MSRVSGNVGVITNLVSTDIIVRYYVRTYGVMSAPVQVKATAMLWLGNISEVGIPTYRLNARSWPQKEW